MGSFVTTPPCRRHAWTGAAPFSLPLGSRAAGVVQGCTELAFRAAMAGGGTVTFTNDCSLLLSQQITVTEPTVIDAKGHKVTISGSNSVALFNATADLTLTGISLVNARSTVSGAALVIQPAVVVRASRCVFAGNAVVATNGLAGTIGTTNSNGTGGDGSAGGAGTVAFGGAIYNLGNAAFTRCVFTNNSVTAGSGGAGGPGANGGGLFAIAGNGGVGGNGGNAWGGAFYNGGNLTVVDCTFSGNSASAGNGGAGGAGGSGNSGGLPGNGGTGGTGQGGALYNALNLTLVTSTFTTNFARGGSSASGGLQGNGSGMVGSKGGDGSGGALHNAWWTVVTNCTFFTNTVFGGAGGNGGNGGGTFGVPGDGGNGGDADGGSLANSGTLTVVTCTFSSGGAYGGTNGVAGTGRFSAKDGVLGPSNGGNFATLGGPASLLGSILANSSSGANGFGPTTDLGYNLSSDATPVLGGTSILNQDPRLRPLAFNGGPTATMALNGGSPALDQIPPELTPPVDQRGFPRPANGAGDIGAFESGAASAPASTVSLAVSHSASGSITISGQGTPGAAYVVETSTNLVNWQSISTNLAPIEFTAPVTNLATRYFRLTR